MPEDMSPGASPFDMRRTASRGRLLWISSWALGFALLGIVLVAGTNHAVAWSSSDTFCGTACHSMTWVAAAYRQSPHYINPVGIRASCGACHVPYDSGHATAAQYVELLLFKVDRGAKDFWYEARKSIATKDEWEKRRPALSNTFQNYLTQHNYITCRGCHSLDAFGGARSHMKVVIHRGLANASSFDCLQCHVNIGHVYEQPASKVNGWYTADKDEPICTTMERLGSLPFVAQPGEAFVYGYNTDILGCVVEKASGMSLDEFVRTRITVPLGLKDTRFFIPAAERDRLAAVYSSDSDGKFVRAPEGSKGQGSYVDGPRKSFAGGAGLTSTAHDYARFLEMIRNGGVLDDVRILAPRTVELMSG